MNQVISVQDEQNIEVIRQYAVLLEGEIRFLKKKLGEADLERSDQQWLSSLEDQLSRLKKKVFASGQEKLQKKDRQVGHAQQELKLHGERAQEENNQESSKNTFQNPTEVVTHECGKSILELEARVRGVQRGAKAFEKLPIFQEAREITVIERTYKEVIHRRRKYRLKSRYNKTGKEVIITAPGPVKIRKSSKYSLEFAITVARDKYEYHIPLERQRRQMEASGLEVEVKTLYGLCEAVAAHCNMILEPIKRDIQKDFCAVHVDESTWPLQGEASKSYMWVMSNRKGSYYQFEPTRSGKIAMEMLKGHSGSVVADGFAGYNRVKKDKNLRLAHCWSHARREFYERIPDYPEAKEAVELIDKLFKIEGEAKSFEMLIELRKTKSKKAVEKLHEWMLKTRAKYLSQEGIHQAINYCLKFWTELTHFLNDLSVPLSNNDAERALRHVVMGRKNFGGSKTINGADTAASIYTVVETCKKLGLQPSQYLKYLITENWKGDRPMTPLQYTLKLNGENKRTTFPKKEDWKID